MSFKIAARTILQLGAELISSDAIAFYELIKNAFDAGSRRVDIDVYVRIPQESYTLFREYIFNELNQKASLKGIEKIKEEILEEIDSAAPNANELKKKIKGAKSWETLALILDGANYIEFQDKGSGMSLADLNEVYLTIGTRSRLKQREEQKRRKNSKPILGEKGIGRLSAMRLGWNLQVKTSQKDEKNWNLLDIDWRVFSHDSDALLEDIEVSPKKGQKKEKPEVQGTQIRISSLTSDWSLEKLVDIATEEFSKLTDPFTPKSHFPISLRFNNQFVKIPRFDELLFENAHAKVEAEYKVKVNKDDSAELELIGKVNYLQANREKVFQLKNTDLVSISESSSSILASLGPFSVTLYWFNRQALSAVETIGDRRKVQSLVRQWAGGLMVFRDGFRVNPYGSPDDDWLNLDAKALASSGYKVNRQQIIGKVSITSFANDALIDQTNREGLRDCDEKRALVSLLKHVLEAQFRVFLNTVDNESRAQLPVTFEDLEERIVSKQQVIQQSLNLLKHKYPKIKNETKTIRDLESAIKDIGRFITEAQELAEEFEQGRTMLLNLASMGMMVEILAHELNRTTQHTLSTLADAGKDDLEQDMLALIATLESQLKTLQKRLSVLDPMSTSGRQVKENFDLVEVIEEDLSSHNAQFQRHNINLRIDVTPDPKNRKFSVRMVKGMVVQIIENLVSNSVYWLKQEQKIDSSFLPEIQIKVDKKSKEIHFTDNGPGIPFDRRDEVFQPFVTTKPPGEGKGLGLYISKEIANYHGASLRLSDSSSIQGGHLNTFILELEGNEK